MIFSFIEPIYYLTDTPFNIEPMSPKAYEYAHMYGQFHWGPSAWLFYTPVTVAIAYKLFVRGGDSIRLGDVCSESRFVKPWLARIIDIFTVFAVLGGLETMQTAVVLTGLPMILVCAVTLLVIYDLLETDWGEKKHRKNI